LKEESGLAQCLFPAHHGGALLGSLALSAWALKQRRPSAWGAVLAMAVFSGLLQASDALFAVWGLLPAFCLSLPLAWEARRRIWALLAVSTGVKVLYQAYLKAQGLRLLQFHWSYFFQNAPRLLGQTWSQAQVFFQAQPLPCLLVPLMALLLLW